MYEDCFLRNTEFSKIGGISIHELNYLEQDFFRLLNYNVFIKNELYQRCEESLFLSNNFLFKIRKRKRSAFF